MGWWCNDCGQEHDTTACPNPVFTTHLSETIPSETIPSTHFGPTEDAGDAGDAEPKFFTKDMWKTDDPEFWWMVRFECTMQLGWALMYMNFLHPHRRIDKLFEDSTGWHNQRIAVQTLCSRLAANQERPDMQWWKAFLIDINNEIENMC